MSVLLLLSAVWLVMNGAAVSAGSPAEPLRVPVVVDWRTGLALYGMEPVGYFAEREAVPGRADLELAFSGAVWRFRNAGNRAAFAANPEIYLPRFGGHDPLAVARGVATPGNPLVWLVHGSRIYLFHTPQAKAAFAANPDAAIAESAAKWPGLMRQFDVTGSLRRRPPPAAEEPPPPDQPKP
jgi:hypothetical protein